MVENSVCDRFIINKFRFNLVFWRWFGNVPSITSSELKKRLDNDEDLILLDVRTEQEWEQTGVIPGSLMIPNYKLDEEINRGLNLNRDKPVIVICRSGKRSKKVAKELQNRDIEAYNLDNGLIGWNNIDGELEEI